MRRDAITQVAKLTGLHPNTIRNYCDRGIIESKRDFRGWRYIPNPLKAIEKLQGLNTGEIHLEK